MDRAQIWQVLLILIFVRAACKPRHNTKAAELELHPPHAVTALIGVSEHKQIACVKLSKTEQK